MSAIGPSRSRVSSPRRVSGFVLCLATLFTGTPDAADRATVSVGDVNVTRAASLTGDAAVEIGNALRLTLRDELARVTGLAPMKRALIVSVILTHLSSERRVGRTKTSATISLALLRADDGVLFAELRGRASVDEASGNLASLRLAALQGAVHGALARLPEVVARAR